MAIVYTDKLKVNFLMSVCGHAEKNFHFSGIQHSIIVLNRQLQMDHGMRTDSKKKLLVTDFQLQLHKS